MIQGKGPDVCKAIGVDGKHVLDVHVRARSDDVLTVTVEWVLSKQELRALGQVFGDLANAR